MLISGGGGLAFAVTGAPLLCDTPVLTQVAPFKVDLLATLSRGSLDAFLFLSLTDIEFFLTPQDRPSQI